MGCVVVAAVMVTVTVCMRAVGMRRTKYNAKGDRIGRWTECHGRGVDSRVLK